jgi:OmcA/MtrC family decaheme c-type cytochrome
MSHQNRWVAAYVSLALFASIVSCGDDEQPGGCTVSRDDASGSATIRCADGTKAVVAVPPAGTCSVRDGEGGSKTIECSDGSSTIVSAGENSATGSKGPQGDPGATGARGAEGSPGMPGRSSSVVGAGLKIEISSVSVPDDLHPVASLQIRDATNQPLDRAGVYTPGAISISFVLARLASAGGTVGEYVPYNTTSVIGATVGAVAPALPNAMQPRAEINGTWTEVDPTLGTYTYRFNQALPSDFDKAKTHTLAIYASRTYAGVAYVSNPVFHFRPDGQAVTETREIVTTAACNKCHGTLAEHGGSRREIGVCITCHVSGMKDPESGNSIDMAQMIHHIHAGKSLPSVVGGTPYRIVGFSNAIHDYSENVFPQPLENCETCHQGGANSDRWKTQLTRTACGACHDRISFMNPPPAGFTLHNGGQQTTDMLCVNCHAEGVGPIATLETDVVKVHRTLTEFPLRDASTGAVMSEPPQLTGSVVSVTPSGPTDIPVVTFRVALNGAPYDILASAQALNRLRFTFAGPTTDYAGYVQYVAQGMAAVGSLAAGSTLGEVMWTPPAGVTMTTIATACATQPAGTFAIGMEGRITTNATRSNATVVSVNYPMHNAVAYFSVTDPTPIPRREAVIVARCNTCHEDLVAHGGSRNDPEYCVLCHSANFNSTNIPAPPVGSTKLTASLRMSFMVHRIHTGENGTQPYIIGTDDFSDRRFPGDRRDCTGCHVPSHYELPLPTLLPTRLRYIDSALLPVAVPDYYIPATGAACTGCHDSDVTVLHIEAMTTQSGAESCASCHGPGKTFDVDVVHAMPGL